MPAEEPMDRELELDCAGKRVPMNRFARAVVLNTMLGLLRSLKGVQADAEITLHLGPAKK
jgi:hypothetical protein